MTDAVGAPGAGPGSDSTAPLRILLVEDQDLNRALVHAIVRRTRQPVIQGADVTDAADLREARAAIVAADFDLVLLDVQLPDGSGLALLEDLAARPDRPRPAVIALTGGALPEQHAAAMRAGCDAILDKPFMADDLIAVAMRHLHAC